MQNDELLGWMLMIGFVALLLVGFIGALMERLG